MLIKHGYNKRNGVKRKKRCRKLPFSKKKMHIPTTLTSIKPSSHV